MTAELCACACVMGCEQEAYRDTLLQTLVEAPNSTIPPDRLWPVMYVDFTLPNLLLVRSLRLGRGCGSTNAVDGKSNQMRTGELQRAT
jgi:hypothetical protein